MQWKVINDEKKVRSKMEADNVQKRSANRWKSENKKDSEGKVRVRISRRRRYSEG